MFYGILLSLAVCGFIACGAWLLDIYFPEE